MLKHLPLWSGGNPHNGRREMKTLFKIVVTLLCLVVVALGPTGVQLLTNFETFEPPLPGAQFRRGAVMVVVGMEGEIPLFHDPCRPAARTIPVGTLVHVVDEVTNACGRHMVLVELRNGGGRGWVAAGVLADPNATGPIFGAFRLCAGDARGPAVPCGAAVAFAPQGMWLSWDFAGLKQGDIVQRVLVVNGQRFQSPPVRWSGAAAGRQLVNVVEGQPALAPGLWTVQFIVNGKPASQATFEVR
jgi:hypothetical protein